MPLSTNAPVTPRLLRRLGVVALAAAAARGQETRPADDVWKGGVAVPAGAVAVVDALPVPVDAFLDELAQRYLRREDPQAAKVLENLVSEALVRRAAESAGVEVSDADVQGRFEDLARQMRSADPNLDLADQIAKSGVSLDVFRKKLRTLCLLDRLARVDQKIPEAVPVEPKHHHTWLANRRKTAVVETNPDKLPAGAAAVVDGATISLKDFARDYLQKADRAEIRRVLDMIARSTLMEATLKAQGAELTDADLATELAARKAEFEAKPQYQGIDFAEIVRQTTGLTAERWTKSRGFRLEAGYAKLGRRFAQKDDVQEFYEKNLGYFGPRLTVKHLLIRGSDRPASANDKGPPPQPMAKARTQIAAVQAELRAGKRFEDLVQLYSEDVSSKLSGGGLEPFTPGESRLHPVLVQAALALDVGAISPAIESPVGVHLLKLEKKDPPPSVEAVEPTIRRELGLRRFKELWNAARYGVDVKVD